MNDDADVDELNLYVEDISEVTDSTEKLLSKITQKDAEIRQLKEEITNLESEIISQSDAIKQFKLKVKVVKLKILKMKLINLKLKNIIAEWQKDKKKLLMSYEMLLSILEKLLVLSIQL